MIIFGFFYTLLIAFSLAGGLLFLLGFKNGAPGTKLIGWFLIIVSIVNLILRLTIVVRYVF